MSLEEGLATGGALVATAVEPDVHLQLVLGREHGLTAGAGELQHQLLLWLLDSCCCLVKKRWDRSSHSLVMKKGLL